jgi:hypothetical protein
LKYSQRENIYALLEVRFTNQNEQAKKTTAEESTTISEKSAKSKVKKDKESASSNRVSNCISDFDASSDYGSLSSDSCEVF